jgi:hypothetical protein
MYEWVRTEWRKWSASWHAQCILRLRPAVRGRTEVDGVTKTGQKPRVGELKIDD